MNNATRVVSWIGVVALVAGALHAQQGGGGCPNRQAWPKPAQVEDIGPYDDCGYGIKVFGQSFNLPGRRCPEGQLLFPAHGECIGVFSEGTRCVQVGELPVRTRQCDCSGIGLLGFGVTSASCDCGPWALNAGYVANMGTELCPPPDEGGAE